VRCAIALLVFCFFGLSLFGQEQGFIFKGQVLDADKKTAVAYASIKLVDQNKGVASDESGYFTFEAQIGDQIRISSIGYHPQIFIITEAHEQEEQVIQILMLPKTYELDSVEVFQLRDNFYLKRPIWDTLKIENPYLTNDPINWGKTNTFGNTDGTAGITITGFLNSFDKDLQQKKYLQRFSAAERFRKEREVELARRFNKEIVKNITRIDDRVIDEFMAFCDFRDGVILNSTAYELTIKILEKYKLFLKR